MVLQPPPYSKMRVSDAGRATPNTSHPRFLPLLVHVSTEGQLHSSSANRRAFKKRDGH